MTLWERFKMDFIERFMNFETAKGMYLIPAGLVVIYTTLFHFQFLFTAVALLFGWYCVSEGLRKVFVNRIKQSIKTDTLLEKRINADVDIKA